MALIMCAVYRVCSVVYGVHHTVCRVCSVVYRVLHRLCRVNGAVSRIQDAECNTWCKVQSEDCAFARFLAFTFSHHAQLIIEP